MAGNTKSLKKTVHWAELDSILYVTLQGSDTAFPRDNFRVD
jgi:hypothetical protein